MAGSPGGLTTSIRRKLQDGKTPEEIVKELVAGGLTEVSAQRFVDRAIAEDATAPPLPPLPETPAPADSLDQFLQTKTAAAEASAAKTGRKQLWIASSLMCGGILITAVSYITADAGERFTLMCFRDGSYMFRKTVRGVVQRAGAAPLLAVVAPASIFGVTAGRRCRSQQRRP